MLRPTRSSPVKARKAVTINKNLQISQKKGGPSENGMLRDSKSSEKRLKKVFDSRVCSNPAAKGTIFKNLNILSKKTFFVSKREKRQI